MGYAIRAKNMGEFVGTQELGHMGWYTQKRKKKPHDVAPLEPNAWEFFDMLDNVCEQCSNEYGKTSTDNGINPTEPPFDSY